LRIASRCHSYGMRRELSRLADSTFDLLVVGAGIHGACAAWDAALRGLSVAVVDQGDFGAATSANSLRIVHGGLRYLARGDFARMRESIRERSALLRIAPQLVEPLPVLVATHGTGLRSRMALRVALALNDSASIFRNRGLSAGRDIPRGRVLSREECVALFPGFASEGVTGGALWYDAQLRHPERLTLSFLRSAANHGAVPVNYARMDELLTRNGKVAGAIVTDAVGGRSFEIRSRAVLIAAGPWTSKVTAQAKGAHRSAAPSHALGVNVIIQRRLAEVAVGVQAHTGPDRDPVQGGRRFLFLAPSGQTTLLGTWYSTTGGADPEGEVNRGARMLVQEFNEACPGSALDDRDVLWHQWGWLPLKAGIEPGRPDALAERPRIVDHGSADGIRGLYSVEGVKFTTARRVAERAIDLVFKGLRRKSPRCRTSETPLDQGTEPDVRYAVREEMAIKLADIMFRRTSLGGPPGPERSLVEATARAAGVELGWDAARLEEEIEDVMRRRSTPGAQLEAVG
jgi:glycerol-3-phosphate dehydrogenase